MRKRAKKVIRFHKINQTKNPHEFIYSEMQKYVPHYHEEELFPDNFEKCARLFERSIETLNMLKLSACHI